MITKKELQQVYYLNREIEMLKNQIISLEPQMASDKVKGSMIDFPYTLQNLNIYGIDEKAHAHRRKKYEKKLKEKLGELERLVAEINSFIDNIYDSLIRQALALKYINNLEWDEVATYIGGGNTADSIRMMCNRFLQKQ